MNDSQFEAPADHLNRSGTRPPSAPLEQALSTEQAAHAALPWLRMWVQAGVTALPISTRPTAAEDGNASAEHSVLVEDWMSYWSQNMVAPMAAAGGAPPSRSPAVAPGTVTPHAGAVAALGQGSTGQGSTGQGSTEQGSTEAPAARPSAASRSPVTGTEVTGGSGSVSPAPTNGAPEGRRRTPWSPSPREPGSTAPPALRFSGSPDMSAAPISGFPNLPDAERMVELQVLSEQVAKCQACPELVRNRTQTVFGTGNIRPRLVMMGEAPGVDEDRLGEPMVGLSGQLLDKIIQAMKMERGDVYILNAAKCRPPGNRNPSEIECQNCRPFWEKQIEILQPEVIVCLGAVASKTLLQTNMPVGKLRGQFHDYRGIAVAVTYHPSYLLRTTEKKRDTWEDMKMVLRRLGLEI